MIESDLPAIISQAITAERIQPMVDKAISEVIKDAIGSATGYRSAFREELTKQLTEAMPHGLSIDDCAKFQHVLNMAVTEAVRGSNAQSVQAAMNVAIKQVIPDVPSRIKLSELVEEARQGSSKEQYDSFYAHLEISDYGGTSLYLDRSESCREKYRAGIMIAFTEGGEVYSLRLDGRDITPKSMPTVISRFDSLLLSMYVGRTSIDMDLDESEVENAADAQHD